MNWLSHAIRSYRLGDLVLGTGGRGLRQAREEHAKMIKALTSGDRDRLIHLSIAHLRPSMDAYRAKARLSETGLSEPAAAGTTKGAHQ